MSAAAAVLTLAAVHDTVSNNIFYYNVHVHYQCELLSSCSTSMLIVLSFFCSVYEAGKMAKSGPPAQVPVYPYYIPGVPSVVPLAPSSHVEPKMASVPSIENNLVGSKC